MDVPKVGPLMGITAGLVWRGFETWSQISFRNRVRLGGRGRVCVPRECSAAAAWATPRGERLPCMQSVRGRRAGTCSPLLGAPTTPHTPHTTRPTPPHQILVANDWARTKVFGRDTSRV